MFWTLRWLRQPCVRLRQLAYGAVRRHIPHVDVRYGDLRRRSSTSINVRRRKPIHNAYNDAFSSHARACEENANLLKAGNRALESVGFMTQRAPCRLLPTGHHTSDLVPLPSGTLPDNDALLRNIARPPPPDMPGNYCRRLC